MVILSIQWRPFDSRDWSLFMWGGGGDIFCFSMKEKTWLTAHLLSHYTKRLSQLLFYLLLSQFLTCSPPSLQWLRSEYYPLASFSMILQCQGRIQGEGAGGAHPPPPGMTCARFLINTVQSLDRHTKSALSFDMYSQQFTLCYFLVKSPLLRIRF